MMAGGTETGVKAIIDTTLTNDKVRPFLNAAKEVVANALADEGYSVALLTQIENWLAAHFIAARDPRIASETTGKGSWKYEGRYDLGLQSTSYGQRVMLLDHHGKLAEVSQARARAKMKVVG